MRYERGYYAPGDYGVCGPSGYRMSVAHVSSSPVSLRGDERCALQGAAFVTFC